VLEELAAGDHPLEFLVGEEEIVYAVDLVVAARPRGGRDHETERQPALSHPVDDGVFPHTRGPGDHDEERLLLALEKVFVHA
jgi:hypothetical protein